MDGIVGVMKRINLMGAKMESDRSLMYDKIDAEEIIARLKRILDYLQDKSKEKLKNGNECTNPSLS